MNTKRLDKYSIKKPIYDKLFCSFLKKNARNPFYINRKDTIRYLETYLESKNIIDTYNEILNFDMSMANEAFKTITDTCQLFKIKKEMNKKIEFKNNMFLQHRIGSDPNYKCSVNTHESFKLMNEKETKRSSVDIGFCFINHNKEIIPCIGIKWPLSNSYKQTYHISMDKNNPIIVILDSMGTSQLEIVYSINELEDFLNKKIRNIYYNLIRTSMKETINITKSEFQSIEVEEIFDYAALAQMYKI